MSMNPQELKTIMSSGLLSFPLTDFDAKGDFNKKGYIERLEWLAPYGASALFAAGGTGEFFSLTADEYPEIIKTAVDTCRGKVPIIAGAGGPTRFAIQCAQEAERAGAHQEHGDRAHAQAEDVGLPLRQARIDHLAPEQHGDRVVRQRRALEALEEVLDVGGVARGERFDPAGQQPGCHLPVQSGLWYPAVLAVRHLACLVATCPEKTAFDNCAHVFLGDDLEVVTAGDDKDFSFAPIASPNCG